MIIPVNFPVPSTSTPKLPSALAKISHNELVLVELQGELEVECTNDRERDGRLVGRLCIDDAAKKPTLMIGHHLLEGKVAQLPKPFAVIRHVSSADPDAMDCDLGESQVGGAFDGVVGRDCCREAQDRVFETTNADCGAAGLVYSPLFMNCLFISEFDSRVIGNRHLWKFRSAHWKHRDTVFAHHLARKL
ncbi:Chromosome transmission fidelity protein 8 [Mycena venus]|uniref:Chromosome transmission fidelity protein 8 n=1 Tax=Mycena venus TaxID=2733690 RepID=A0A8H6X9D9_9AGAR|nr:Chromosome transmission fidelity protein 8 [Mycena venus]